MDEKFLAFQKAIDALQTESSIPTIYKNLEDYKNAFELFKTTGDVSVETLTEVSNRDFEQFQKFIKKYFREYSSLDEFEMRYNLFLTVLNKFKGYNIGGDLIGINRLSDKTCELTPKLELSSY